MGEADAKTNKIGLYILAAVFAVLLLITFIPGLYTHKYFTDAAGWMKFTGFVLLAGWAYLYKKSFKAFVEDTVSTTAVFAGLFLSMALIMGFLWGFKFDL